MQVKKEPWYAKIAWLKNIVKLPDQKHFFNVMSIMICFMLAGAAPWSDPDACAYLQS